MRINWKTVGGALARAGMQAGGGAAASCPDSPIGQVGGAVAIISGVIWSLIQKDASGILKKE